MSERTPERELTALRRLADDVHSILRSGCGHSCVPWDRLTAAYNRCANYREGRDQPTITEPYRDRMELRDRSGRLLALATAQDGHWSISVRNGGTVDRQLSHTAARVRLEEIGGLR